MRLLAPPFIFLVLWPTLAAATVVSDRADKTDMAIYHDFEENSASYAEYTTDPMASRSGIAFVTEVRTVNLSAGSNTIEFRNVVSTIVPQTAEIQGLPSAVSQQNFDYDLLSPGSLLAKSIGQTVTLVRASPGTGKPVEQKAIVRNGPDGIFLEIAGTLEAVHCSGLPEKLVFDKIPSGLRPSPTLSVQVSVDRPGRYTLKLSYIVTGLNWAADYIAHVRRDGHTLDLFGWITLVNFSDTSFHRIPLQVVAGRAMETGDDTPVRPAKVVVAPSCWPLNIDWATSAALRRRLLGLGPQTISPSPITAVGQQEYSSAVETVVVTGSRIPEGRLGDYKIYQLPELTDVASHQTKQVQFLDQHGVPFDHFYRFRLYPDDPESDTEFADSEYRLSNTEAAMLGKSLPFGTFSLMADSADGSMVLLGQQDIHDTPKGLPIRIDTGYADNIAVRRRVVSSETLGAGHDKVQRRSLEIQVDNDKSIAVPFELQLYVDTDTRLVAEDQPHVVEPEGLVWSFSLNPGERQVIHLTIESKEY